MMSLATARRHIRRALAHHPDGSMQHLGGLRLLRQRASSYPADDAEVLAAGALAQSGTCPLCGRPLAPAPAHRPRQDPSAARMVRSFRCRPSTLAAIDAEAKRLGISAGQALDRIMERMGLP